MENGGNVVCRSIQPGRAMDKGGNIYGVSACLEFVVLLFPVDGTRSGLRNPTSSFVASRRTRRRS